MANNQEKFEEAIEAAYEQGVTEWKTAVLVYADWLIDQDSGMAEKLRLLMDRAEILHDRTDGELSTLENFQIKTGYVYRISTGENGETAIGEDEDETGIGFHGSDVPPTDGDWLTDETDGYLILHQSQTVGGIDNHFGWDIESVDLEADWHWYEDSYEVVLVHKEGTLHWIAVSV